jgi:hypothetical protein
MVLAERGFAIGMAIAVFASYKKLPRGQSGLSIISNKGCARAGQIVTR